MVGYGSKKLRVLSAEDVGVVNSIVINLALPAYIFASVHGSPLKMSMVKAPFLGLAMEMVVIVVAYLFARMLKLDRPTTASLMLASTFGNTGYLGYPVVTAAFDGDKASILTAVMMDSFAMRLGLTTVGVAVVTSFAGSRFEWKSALEFLKTPIFAAVVIGLLLRTANVPDYLMTSIDYLGRATVPLSMISVGLSLSSGTVRQYPLPILVAFVLKMVALPLLVYAGLPLLGMDRDLARVVVLEMAMPSAVFTGVIASKYGGNGAFSAGAIFVTTLISVVTLPLVLRLM